MQQPLHVVLVFWTGTELRNVHLPVPRGKGKETESRASCLHTRDVSVAATTLFLLHWELGLDVATPNFGRGCWNNTGITWPLAGHLCVQPQSYFMEDGKDGFCWTTGCLCLQLHFLTCKGDIIMEYILGN